LGGVEAYTQNLAAALVARGRRVAVVTSRVSSDPAHVVEPSGVEVFRLPCWGLLGGRLPISRRNAQYRQLMARLDAFGAGRVLVNTRFYRHSIEGLRFAQRAGVRAVMLDHGSAHITMGNRAIDVAVEAYEHAITRIDKRFAPDFYGVSAASCRWLEHFGIEARGVLNNSIDAAQFRAQSSGRDFRAELGICAGELVVAFTGRLIPEKGVGALCEAAAALERAGAPVRVLVAGAGPLGAQLERQAPANMTLLGKLDKPDVVALMQCADALCLPSRSEGFSTSLLEGAACGAALITTNVGGAEELVATPQHGVILPSAQPADIEQGIMRLVRQPGLAQVMGQNARQLVEAQYSWDETAAKIEQACAAAQH
jgi:glycosyltransferase involved in cell wall biosynthesis